MDHLQTLAATPFPATFDRIKRLSPVRYVIVVGLFAGLLAGALSAWMPGDDSADASYGLINLLGALLVAPILETFLFQFVPVMLTRSFGVPWGLQWIASVGAFTIGHAMLGWEAMLTAGLLVGSILGATFVLWSTDSLRKGFWMTAAVHAISNLVVAALIVTKLGGLPGA